MNLILLFDTDFTDGNDRVRLTGRRAAHINEVHKAQPGDTLRVGLLNGNVGSGTVTSMSAGIF